MDRRKISLLIHTLKYLRFKQIVYRLFYFFRNRFFKKEYQKLILFNVIPLNWETTILNTNSSFPIQQFQFLNIPYMFKREIDWNFNGFGKLWTYNLNYFDFLNQEEIKTKEGIDLIYNYIEKDSNLIDGKEPYPISLRGINWVKFLAKNKIQEKEVNQILYNHYQILLHNLEYHILGNHLLENGFSLFFGAYYFRDEILYKKAAKILVEELKEQILNDGAHFELSPMYHQILLYRILDCIQLGELNAWKQDDLIAFFKKKALKMLSWLEVITFNNGEIPMVNDSAYGIAPTSKELFKYAEKLQLNWRLTKLSESGYRMYKSKKYELFADIGNVGPTYQPGHAHSDTFNFELYVNNKPVFVDTGISTYEKNKKRQKERETASHNTVKIGDEEQTQVWGGFRVAKRAKIVNFKEDKNYVEATHNGYSDIGVLHTRKFCVNESSIVISDMISKDIDKEQVAFFHLHPNIKKVSINKNEIDLNNEKIHILLNGSIIKIEVGKYEYALGFNKTIEAQKIKVYFKTNLTTQIEL